MEYMKEILHFTWTLVPVIMSIVVSTVKALLPVGVLPRKSVCDEICLITGAGSGIGRLMAIEFAKLGCTLGREYCGKRGDERDDAQDGSDEAPPAICSALQVHTYTVDLSKREQINQTAERVAKEVGTVDILINNAGVVTGKNLTDSPDEWIERTMAVNASACLYTAKNFVRRMVEMNHGHVVTIASVAGKVGGAGVVDYCTSKFAAVGFHESLAAEMQHLRADGVKTTLVCPYIINTGMFAGVENKSQNLVSILEPEYVVECIMEAVLTNKAELIMPKIVYALAILQFIPTEVKHILCEYLGQYDAMDTFKGRQHPISA